MENTVWLARTSARDLSAAVRELLAVALGFSAAVAADGNGKPYLPAHPELHISLAHTKGAVACAVSACPVGIDLECAARCVSDRLAGRCFTTAELEWAGTDFTRRIEVWTRKEALLKREGIGIRLTLNEVETVGHPQIVTRQADGFVVSFCGNPAEFTLLDRGEL